MSVKLTVLIDNINNLGETAERVGAGNAVQDGCPCAAAQPRALHAEWGFAAFIQFNGRNILLDTGASPLFTANAETLGVDLTAVEAAVLSHAHYDHADGMDAFFQANATAPFYLREGSAENCYHYGEDGQPEYIGIKRGTLTTHADRIRFAAGNLEILPGVWLVPHTTPGLETIGKAMGMFTLEEAESTEDVAPLSPESPWPAGLRPVTETFAHEQSLILDTPRGLVIFNSCSHGGVDAIISEARAALPGRPVLALIGGLHLYKTAPEDVRALARRIQELGIQHVYTGHCTGAEAFTILREELGETVQQFHSGFTAEL